MIGQLTFGFIERVAIALAIGALLGMEREYSKKQVVVGVRTFALVSLLGALFVLFAELTGDVLQLLLGFLAVTALVVVLYASNLSKFKSVGMTTSIALLLSYVLGVLVGYGNVSEAVFVTIAVALVMFTKKWLHRFISKLSSTEVLDFLEFLALVGIVYPLVPAAPVVVHGVAIDLMDIWLLVFLLAIINFVGFVGSRYVRGKRQIELMGFLGGMISSTVMSYTMCEAYKANKKKDDVLSSAYFFINSSMVLRNLVILAVLLPAVARLIAVPVLASCAFLLAVGIWKARRGVHGEKMKIKSPFEMGRAVSLVAKLAIVLVALEAIIVYLPNVFYLAAFLGGVTSSASTMASLPVLVETGKITVHMAAMGASVAILADFLIGNVIVYWLAGAWGAAKKALPWALAAAVAYGVLLAALA